MLQSDPEYPKGQKQLDPTVMPPFEPLGQGGCEGSKRVRFHLFRILVREHLQAAEVIVVSVARTTRGNIPGEAMVWRVHQRCRGMFWMQDAGARGKRSV